MKLTKAEIFLSLSIVLAVIDQSVAAAVFGFGITCYAALDLYLKSQIEKKDHEAENRLKKLEEKVSAILISQGMRM